MIAEIAKLGKKPFVRNVTIVATGTVAAQVVTLAFTPLVTRMYGPEAFGVLGVFMSMLGIVSPMAALSYPIAIVISKSDVEASGLVQVSLYTAVAVSLISTFMLAAFKTQIVSLLQIEAITPFLYLIPLVIIFSACLQVTEQLMIRTKQFRVKARASFLSTLFLNSAKVGIGLFSPVATVLIVLATVSNAINAFILVMNLGVAKTRLLFGRPFCITSLRKLAIKYRDFPFFRSPQILVNSISQSLPVLLLSAFSGPASAGLYTISKNVLVMPTRLIGKSVGDVLYPRIAEAVNKNDPPTFLLIKMTLALVAIGTIPFGIVVVFGPWLFGFVFGTEWVLAGEYAKWLALLMFGMLINRPSVAAIPALGLQRHFLVYEVFTALLKVFALLFGFYFFHDELVAVALYSLVGLFCYIGLIVWVIRKSMSLRTKYRAFGLG